MRILIGIACAAWLLLAPGPAAAQTYNECGCYRDESGGCRCIRAKSKCGCPGECEPVGCEEKREKKAEKEAQAELKRIAAREKKSAAEAAKAAREKEKAERAAEKAKKAGEKTGSKPIDKNKQDKSLKNILGPEETAGEEKK